MGEEGVLVGIGVGGNVLERIGTYSLILGLIWHVILLMWTRNNSGSSAVPCGTPEETFTSLILFLKLGHTGSDRVTVGKPKQFHSWCLNLVDN